MRKDIQKNRVYRWEDSIPLLPIGFTGERDCSMRCCRELIEHACNLYGLPVLEARPPRNLKQTYACYQPYYIELPKHFQRKDIALHEAAHYITDVYWTKASDHGAVFVRVYMHLLHEILGVEVKSMESWARFHKVRFARISPYAPDAKSLDPWKFASLQMNINAYKILK